MRINQTSSRLGVVFYILAVVTGLFLIVISTWADMEADSYGFPRRASATLRELACPILLRERRSALTSIRRYLLNPWTWHLANQRD